MFTYFREKSIIFYISNFTDIVRAARERFFVWANLERVGERLANLEWVAGKSGAGDKSEADN